MDKVIPLTPFYMIEGEQADGTVKLSPIYDCNCEQCTKDKKLEREFNLVKLLFKNR